MSDPKLNRFNPPSLNEQRRAEEMQKESEYVPCKRCRDTTHVNALDSDGYCPSCHYIEEEGDTNDESQTTD